MLNPIRLAPLGFVRIFIYFASHSSSFSSTVGTPKMVRRFERIFDAVEPIEQYRSGGYHPVHLEDVFNSKYKVIGKLGHGRHSTVWLAVDQQ